MNRQMGMLAAALAGAVAIVVAAVVVSQAGTGEPDAQREAAPAATLLRGVPEDGVALGRADAPVTLVEFADLQCPFCARFSTDVLPALVREHVRAGELRIEFRNLAFLGPESLLAARTAQAAALQDGLWGFVERLFARQPPENSGQVTDEFLRSVAAEVPGLDVARLFEERDDRRVDELLERAATVARERGITGTPSFLVGPTDGDLEPLAVDALEPQPFLEAVRARLPGS